jgi:hypothetical protein
MRNLLFTLILVTTLAFLGSNIMAQTVAPFSGNLDRPIPAWAAEGAEDEMAPEPPPDPEEEEDPDDDDEEQGDPPTFMDEELEGSQIILCLDASCSMGSSYNPGFPVYSSGGSIISYPNRWQTVQSEAANAISGMTEDHEFDVITYDTPVQSCFGCLTPGTPGNKQQAISWVYARYIAGCTNSYDALLLAFSNYGNELDCIMFMSDGMPNTALSLGIGACAGWGMESTIIAMAQGGIGAQQNEGFKLLVIQVGGSPMSFMVQLGNLQKAEFILK